MMLDGRNQTVSKQQQLYREDPKNIRHFDIELLFCPLSIWQPVIDYNCQYM